jgi:large subunit ribosomal protein L30
LIEKKVSIRNLHKQLKLRLRNFQSPPMYRIAKSARQCLRAVPQLRCLATEATQSSPANPEPISPPNTHFKITLRRSAIALGEKKQKTLLSLGLTHRFQTTYMPHSPQVAGKILLLKELVEVENVPTSEVRTKQEMTKERRAPRGYVVKHNKLTESPLDS